MDEQIGLYIFQTLKVRRIALVVVIIAGANHEEITAYFYRVPFIMAKDGPDVFGRRPGFYRSDYCTVYVVQWHILVLFRSNS